MPRLALLPEISAQLETLADLAFRSSIGTRADRSRTSTAPILNVSPGFSCLARVFSWMHEERHWPLGCRSVALWRRIHGFNVPVRPHSVQTQAYV